MLAKEYMQFATWICKNPVLKAIFFVRFLIFINRGPPRYSPYLSVPLLCKWMITT